jgi:signal transduction histidine kinase/integral membrane sensor domain MASE1
MDKDWLRAVIVAAVYVAAAKLGIELSVAHGVVTPVWAPSGISLAVLLLFGVRLWPGVALGAFVANATSDVSIPVAGAIAIGNTLEAVAGAYLLRRFGFDNRLARVRDVIVFVLLGALLSTTIAATNGVTTLVVADEIASSSFGSQWLLWWFGDVIGDLLVAPLVLVWFSFRRQDHRGGSSIEGVVLLGVLIATSLIVFIGGSWRYPYLLFPLLVWAALRFQQLGAATAMFVVGAIATWGIVEGAIPIGGATSTQSVQILQGLVAVVGASCLTMAASLMERDEVQDELRRAHSGLAEAQAVAHLGSWEWDIPNDVVTWSDEMYRIYGHEPGAFEVTFEKAMEQVATGDQAAIAANVEGAFAGGKDSLVPDVQYRITLPDGTQRVLLGGGAVRFDDNGQPVRMVGTVKDVTELAQTAEQLREAIEMKNTFMSSVSHDLRTPMATISGLANAARQHMDRLDTAELQDILRSIDASAERGSHLLTNLLDVDRVTSGAVEPKRARLDLKELVANALEGIDMGDHPIEVSGESVVANVDRTLVERMVDNLLLNAHRYTPDGTPVWLKISNTGDDALITVEDAGHGVSDENKSEIFKAFESTSGGVGTGLGLFLVTRFAELHGGRAWVEDRPGGGASFKVLLPRG